MECEERMQNIVAGFENCRHAFSAIGDETRQLILLTLLQGDSNGIRVGDIANNIHLTRPSVSHHLQILKEAGIVAMRKEGTKNFYYLSMNETKWQEIAALINMIYDGIQCISKQTGGQV